MSSTPIAPLTRFVPVLLAILGALPVAPAQSTIVADASKPHPTPWPGEAVCAVSLSYDDSIPVHHLRVAPLLDQHGLHATFYLSVKTIDDAAAWKTVAAHGHELGNHSLFHPCRRETADGYAWLPEHYNLLDYTPGRWRDELAVANFAIDLLDGGKPRTYGNNCTNLTFGRGDKEQPMDPILAELFVAARGAITNQSVDPAQPNFTRLGHYSGDGKKFAHLRAEIEQARAKKGWIIYMFHGVGEGTHPLFIADEEHRQLLEWLAHERTSIWTAPVVEVATRLKVARSS
jgi:peptidoglycan-N-acetylglucosamine deacetylase